MSQREQELTYIIGLMLTQLGGKLEITKDTQIDYKHGEKELMIRIDPITSVMSMKFQKPHKVKG